MDCSSELVKTVCQPGVSNRRHELFFNHQKSNFGIQQLWKSERWVNDKKEVDEDFAGRHFWKIQAQVNGNFRQPNNILPIRIRFVID